MHHGRQGHRGSIGRKEKLFAAREVQKIGQRQERERFQYRAQKQDSNLGKGGRRNLWKRKEKKVLSSPKLRLQFTGRKKTVTPRHRSLLVRPMPLIRISSSALVRRISRSASRSMLICSPGMSIGIRRLIPATPLSGSGLSAES